VQVTILFIRLTCRYIVAPREWGEPLMIGTPGRARTDTGALLGGSPLPLGYGGAKIVPHLAPFIQTFRGIGQVAIIDDQIDISHAHNCAVAHAICHCCRWGGGRSSTRGRRPTSRARCPGCARAGSRAGQDQATRAWLAARRKMASSIGPVTRPVKVFCWLG